MKILFLSLLKYLNKISREINHRDSVFRLFKSIIWQYNKKHPFIILFRRVDVWVIGVYFFFLQRLDWHFPTTRDCVLPSIFFSASTTGNKNRKRSRVNKCIHLFLTLRRNLIDYFIFAKIDIEKSKFKVIHFSRRLFFLVIYYIQ